MSTILHRIITVGGGFLIFFAVHFIETTWFPVVENFTVTSSRLYDETLTLSGHMVKKRDCAVVSTSAYANFLNGPSVRMVTHLGDGEQDTSGAVGWQAWGPWEFRPITDSPKPVQVSIHIRYRCHFVWTAEQQLTAVAVPQ